MMIYTISVGWSFGKESKVGGERRNKQKVSFETALRILN